MKKQKTSLGWLVVAVVVAGLSWSLKQGEKGALAQSGDRLEQVGVVNTSQTRSKQGAYDVLENCQLLENRRNDGDSFVVRHAGGETEFRLYYVDAPESQYKEYRDGNSNGARLREQGDYFGGLNRDATADAGQQAKKVSLKLLSSRPFRVYTKWDNVYGPQRKYAFVEVSLPSGPKYLHEILVEKGLGRIHTRGAEMPSGLSSNRQKARLRKLEAEAKRERRGAWAM